MTEEIVKAEPRDLALLNQAMEMGADPATFSPEERRMVVAHLKFEVGSVTSVSKLAEKMNVSVTTIRRDLEAIRKSVGKQTGLWTLDDVLGNMMQNAERCIEMAYERKDYGSVWGIVKDQTKLLKEMGVVESKNEQNALTITIKKIEEAYPNALTRIATSLDPMLTGEVIDVEAEPVAPRLDTSGEGASDQDGGQ